MRILVSAGALIYRGKPVALDIPFSLSGVHYGFSDGKGTLYIEEDLLVLNITIKVLGMFDSPREIIKVEPAVLGSIELEKGWWKDELKLRARKTKLLKAVPGSHEGSVIRLKVHRKYRDRVYDLLDAIELLALDITSSET